MRGSSRGRFRRAVKGPSAPADQFSAPPGAGAPVPLKRPSILPRREAAAAVSIGAAANGGFNAQPVMARVEPSMGSGSALARQAIVEPEIAVLEPPVETALSSVREVEVDPDDTREAEGAIDRVHGGARIAEGSSVEVAFQERANQNLAAKRALAAACYAALNPHGSVFLDAGTTVLQLARLMIVSQADPNPPQHGCAVVSRRHQIAPQTDASVAKGEPP